MGFTRDEYDLIDIVSQDVSHVGAQAHPECTDHQLRHVSVQLRSLLIDGQLIKCWKRLDLQPKQPRIIAPRMLTDGLNENAVAFAAGGKIGEVSIADVIHIDRDLSEFEVKEMVEQRRRNLGYEFLLADYKESCSIFIKGKKIKRRHVVSYVANNKGGARLDSSRKNDEEAYRLLDAALDSSWSFGGRAGPDRQEIGGSKDPVFMELLSIGQQITRSADIQRLIVACKSALGQAS